MAGRGDGGRKFPIKSREIPCSEGISPLAPKLRNQAAGKVARNCDTVSQFHSPPFDARPLRGTVARPALLLKMRPTTRRQEEPSDEDQRPGPEDPQPLRERQPRDQ